MGYLDKSGLSHLWEKIKTALSGKQDKLTGTQGQVVGFDRAGNAVAQDAPSGGVSSFNGRTGAVTPQAGDYSVSDVTGAAPTESPVFTRSISMGRTEGSSVGDSSVAFGLNNTVSGARSYAEGRGNTVAMYESHVEGADNKLSYGGAGNSHAEGVSNTITANCSHAEGGSNTVSGNYSHAEGRYTTVSGDYSHAEGLHTTAGSDHSHAEGWYSEAKARYSHAGGEYTFAEYMAETAIGRYNVRKSPNSNTAGDLLVVGKGTGDSARANAFRVSTAGVYGTGAFNASGADYAELFEWQDGNPDSEDRAGLFVTLDGERIRVAGPDDDYILGIVSATPSVVGDVYDDQWQGMEVRDVFGRTVMEMRDIPADIGPDGEEITPARRELAPKLNPDYDHTIKYQPRTQRPEWAAVGLLGKLVAVDDGSCQVNGWATVGKGGKATASAARTKYRVMARLDDTHVRLMIF